MFCFYSREGEKVLGLFGLYFKKLWIFFFFLSFLIWSFTTHKCTVPTSQHRLMTHATHPGRIQGFSSGISTKLSNNIPGDSCQDLTGVSVQLVLLDEKHIRIMVTSVGKTHRLQSVGLAPSEWVVSCLVPINRASLVQRTPLKRRINKQTGDGPRNSSFYSNFSRLQLQTLVKKPRTALSVGVSGPRQIKAVSKLSCQELIWFFRGNYGEVMVAFRDGWLFCQSPTISFLSVGDTAASAGLLRFIAQ